MKNKAAINLFFAVYLLMLMLRHVSIGVDLSVYEDLFIRVSQMNWSELSELDTELSYLLLNKAVSIFTNNFQWMIIVTSLIIILPIWYIYRKEVEDPLLTIAFFIILPTFVMFFSGLRQSIAISLGVIALEMTRHKKFIPFIAICLLALTFHRSAFMLFLMYPLFHARITKKWLIAIIPLMGLIFIFNEPIFMVLRNVISEYYESTVRDTGSYSMLILFALLAVFSFVVVDEEKLDADTQGLRNLLLIAVLIQMFVPLNNLAMRMNYYYIIFIPLLIPKIIRNSTLLWTNIAVAAKYVMIIYFMFYFFDHMPSGNILQTFPYKFFWEIGP